MSKILPTILICLSAFGLLACSNSDTPTDGGKSSVKARQDLMRDWRGASDIIKGMSEMPDTFDRTVLTDQTTYLANTSDQMLSHFINPDGTPAEQGGSSEAFLQDPTGFTTAMTAYKTAANNLNVAAQTANSTNDIDPLIGPLIESCGSCHKTYKKGR